MARTECEFSQNRYVYSCPFYVLVLGSGLRYGVPPGVGCEFQGGLLFSFLYDLGKILMC